ncbi:MAG: zinc-dependent alcohol dehydrogenase [Desulfocapsaceae bacterium]
MKSKAMVVTAPEQMELQEFELMPTPADHVLVKTSVTSVCSTDVKVFKGRTPFVNYPLVMGHEVAGEVVEIGSLAKQWYPFAVGDRITIEPYIACGRCRHCRSDHFYHHCTSGGIYGISPSCGQPPHLFGGYSDYFYLVPGAIAHKQNEQMLDSAASISSVVANGVRWVKTLGQVGFGDSVVISGPGSQGLCSLAAALHSGADPVIVLGLECDAKRLQLAREFGAHRIINVEEEDPVESVSRLLPEGADVVIETSGTPSGIQAALKMVRRGGKIINIGLSGGIETSIAFDDLVWKSVSLISGLGQAGNVSDAMKLIDSGRFAFEKINSHTYQLEELASAIRDAEQRPSGFIKGAIVFGR